MYGNKYNKFNRSMIAALFFIAVAFFNTASAAERSERDFIGAAYNGIVVNCHEWISLRYAPSVDSPSIARIPLGTIVIVYDVPINSMDGFSPVTYNGLNGYCLDYYLKYHSGGGAHVE